MILGHLSEQRLKQAVAKPRHFDGLKVFLAGPDVPLDNNRTERALRGVVLGRKNHFGSRSERGTRVAAMMCSLVESAKINRELEQQLSVRNQALFGDKSEKRNRAARRADKKKVQNGHSPREQAELPRIEQVHTLDAADETCPKCGAQLQEFAGQLNAL